MKVKGIIFEDIVNYKKISLTIMMPICSFKCDKECGVNVCQNSKLANSPDIEINPKKIIKTYYLDNPIVEALVFQGLEPFDTFDDLVDFISEFRKVSNDDIVIYTGYNIEEILNEISYLQQYKNIIVKFGRYKPNQKSHFDEVLGVTLASSNQYAEHIS
jgi:hypothetical protein